MAFKKIGRKIKSNLSFLIPDIGLTYSGRIKLRQLPRFVPTIVKFYGNNLKIADVQTFRSSYYEIFKLKIYRFNNRHPSSVIIDCGANIGLATIYFKQQYPDTPVMAFEPDPEIFALMKHNIESFSFSKVELRNEAVSDRDGDLQFISDGGHSGRLTEDVDSCGVNVKAIRLRSLLATYDHISFLKIDIEGEETNVMPDIADQLPKVDYLFLEYHSYLNKSQVLSQLLALINSAGFRYYVQEAVRKDNPFDNQEIFLNMDMVVNIYCYR